MPRAFRVIAALGAVLFALVGLAACGGIPGDAVVSVDGTTRSRRTTFNHWMSVAAASSATAPGAKPVIPDPPKYTACIARTESDQTKPAKGQTPPTEAALKTQCEQQYKSLQQEVLGFLISSTWVLGEASSLGVKVTDKEVKKQFEKIKSQQFPKAAEFEKFLTNVGPDGVRSAAAREAQPALVENPAEDRQREVESHPRADRKVLQRTTPNGSASPKNATC